MSGGRMWTFGHSTRSEEETVSMLRDVGVARVADVRTIRGSRHNPQFGADVMPGWLADAGIDYRWVPRLGGRRGKQGVDPSINAGWIHPSFHHYADYALGDEFAAGLAELIDLAATPIAIMCAEAVPWRCHRSLIATALTVRGWRVTHLLGEGHGEDHIIGRWGATPRIEPSDRIVYPANQPPATTGPGALSASG